MNMRSMPIARFLSLVAVLALLGGAAGGPGRLEAAPHTQDASQYITVVVKAGESLATYARLYGVSGASMMAVNSLKDGNLIYPGQTVVIPVIKSFTPSRTTPFYYVAEAGDTMVSLGQRFEMAANTIARANGGSLTVTPGQTYLIPAGPHIHTVAAGETLKSIAALYRVSVEFLLTGNSLPNPDFIYPGQLIYIPTIFNAKPVAFDAAPAPAPTATPGAGPAPSATPGPTSTPAPAPTPVPGNYMIVTVRRGESLLTYVLRYGVSGASIRAVNPQIKDPNIIYPGDVLVIPVVSTFTPSRTTPFFYVVGAGENAAIIALKFEMNANVLSGANPGVTIAAGATILVPAGPHVYLVKEGETLKSIAAKYGTTADFLLTGNSLPNPDFIYPGQLIFIPLRYNAAPMPF